MRRPLKSSSTLKSSRRCSNVEKCRIAHQTIDTSQVFQETCDSIVSSNGQEDHVSMGANSATQAVQIVENVEQILAIELINASQALFFRTHKISPFLKKFIIGFRKAVPKVSKDRIFHKDLQKSLKFLKSLTLENELFLENQTDWHPTR